MFEESDLVASDIAAALVLLRLKKKYEEVLVQTDNSNANRNLRNAGTYNYKASIFFKISGTHRCLFICFKMIVYITVRYNLHRKNIFILLKILIFQKR